MRFSAALEKCSRHKNGNRDNYSGFDACFGVFRGGREKRRKPNIVTNTFSSRPCLNWSRGASGAGCGLVGTLAAEAIRKFKFDLAVIGCSALERDDDLLDFDIQEVCVSDEILDQSRKTFLTADHGKSSFRAISGPR
ncbi:hypothetical protein JYP49_02300 [Nitratireductor aquimarinus]|nr:hypothetical protein [Nitratireductor pacificus]MBN7779414.1 hypothetical protein [Nitratireductor pacificus]MBN7788221.1 hypothetical protein [Nitratireductor aquimarinus]MBY6098268.1 hypothetical protein [Nitratireductor aquimarinus]